MLKKLLKYDLKYIFKFIIIFYSIALFFGTLTRIFFIFENSFILNLIAQICSGTTISMLFSILINNLMRLWGRFKSNFYKDESYLTHTLPVDKNTLYLSKALASIISLFTSVLVITITLFIAYYSKENLEFIKKLFLPIANIYESSVIEILLLLLFLIFLEFSNALQAGYTGIILGHKRNNNKTVLSIVFGFAGYIIIQLIILLLIFILGLFNSDVMNLFITNEMINISTLKIIVYSTIILYSGTLLINYIINLKLFKQGVNVE